MVDFLIIDTCVWINLAGQPNLFPLIESLKDILDLPNFTLVLPESVKVEFDRHRDEQFGIYKKRFKSHIQNMKEIIKLLPEETNNINNIQELANKVLQNNLKHIQTNINLIDIIFEQAQTEALSETILAEAARRALHKNEPFFTGNSKSSDIGDCLLWITVVNLLEKGVVWFCTENKSDFSNPGRHDTPHNTLDIEAFAKNKNGSFNYFIELEKLIEKILPAKKNLPRYSDYVRDSADFFKPSICPHCQCLSVVKQLFPSGWRYHCFSCNTNTPLFPPDDIWFD